jgi:hypothetical protein
VVQDEIDDGRGFPVVEVLRVAADGGADDGKDSRPDDDAYAERGEGERAERSAQRVLRALGFGDQLVDGLGGEDLPGQRRAPGGRSEGTAGEARDEKCGAPGC